MAALGATTVAAAAIAAGATSAGAATPRSSASSPPTIQQMTGIGPAVSADHPWTINYRDSTGHITGTWHGTRAAADALAGRWQSAHPAPQVVSPAIIKTSSCRLPTTYWVFHAAKLTCYAYGGSLNISINGVYEIDSGNNVGSYRINGHGYSLARFTSDVWAVGQHVTYIHIN
jgi:hypothetical protein